MSKTLTLRLSRTVLRNFCRITAVFLVIIIFIGLFMYSNTKKTLVNELERSNYLALSGYAEQMENFFSSMRRLSSVLALNQMIDSYVRMPSIAARIFNGLYESIQSQLSLAVYSFDYINSIYVISLRDRSYIDHTGYSTIQRLTDTNWMTGLDTDSMQTGRPVIMPRSVNGVYPFVISFITRLGSDANAGYLVINLDIKKLPALIGTNNESNSTFIITDDGSVLYRPMKRALFEDIAQFPELSCFDPNRDKLSMVVDDPAHPYAYTQIHSRQYNWFYAATVHLHDYTESLSVQRGILAAFICALLVLFIAIALLFCLNANKPIRLILKIIENPAEWVTNPDYSSEEVQFIAEQLVRYVQTNNALSIELQKQMNMLNDARLLALQSQINPHFIFNTLNHIHMECVKHMGYSNPVSPTILDFSRLIRYALSAENLVTLSCEIEHTLLFINILIQRFGDTFAAGFDIAPDCGDILIPKLIIQPLIENSIKHGYSGDSDHKTLTVKILARCQSVDYGAESVPSIKLTIHDDGVGIAPEKLSSLRASLATPPDSSGENIGLRNVATRLRLLYPHHSQLVVESEYGRSTDVSLIFPCSEIPRSII